MRRALFIFLGLIILATLALQAAPPQASRSLSSTEVKPGTTIEVTVTVDISEATVGLYAAETYPQGFVVGEVLEDGGAAILRNQPEGDLVFYWELQEFDAGTTLRVRYRVQAPEAPGEYTITGEVGAAVPQAHQAIAGATTVKVVAEGGEDTAPPTFSNNQPADGATVNTAQPPISIEVRDPSGIDTSQLRLTLKEGTERWTFAPGDAGVIWNGLTLQVSLAQTGITLAGGAVQVEVSAQDTVGNAAQTSWSFTVELEAPLTVEQAVAGHSGDPQIIEDEDILWAVELWIEGTPVPGTDGKIIDDATILKLVELWITEEPVSS